jgi:hypothetical protein
VIDGSARVSDPANIKEEAGATHPGLLLCARHALDLE